ncbi:MAG TPA: carboxypeptidase-like regulatory domain-containing protein [Longimicrobiales bacterium]|nr:carboxypeptidase-like regulatory domain-containing protein [Longimicrobiales bacterium]
MRYRLASVAAILLLWPGAAEAQSIIGRTITSTGRAPVAGVAVQLVDSTGGVHRSVVTDSAGVFRLRASAGGRYTLQATMIGYAPVVSEPLALPNAGILQVEVLMDHEALPLDPVRVLAEGTMRTGVLAEYFDRVERGVRGGTGRIFTRENIEEGNYREMRHLLLAVPVRRGCPMAFFIDGMPASAREMDVINPEHVEGVEIYTSRTAVPPQYENRVVCGATFVWMRRDLPGRSFTWAPF